MTASDAESWARLRLVEGESSAKKWELVSSLGHTTLTVGSNSDCTWVVRGDGVRPIHFSLHWDGSRLRVADVYGAGDVTVDGAVLSSQWKPLSGRVRIEFGKAAMVVEASASPTSSPPRSAETLLDAQAISAPLPASTAPSASAVASTQAIFGGAGAGSSSPPPPSTRPEPRPASSGPRNIGKGTLIGVAPQTLIEAKMLENYQPPSVTSELPDGVSAKDARRAERSRLEREKAERERSERPSMKATLVGGLGFGMKHAPSARPPSPSEPAGPASAQPDEAPASSVEAKSPRSGPSANATLMGFNAAEVLRGIVGTHASVSVGGSEPVPGVVLSEPEQRNTLGFPREGKPSSSAPPNITIGGPVGRRMTQRGVISQPPGVEPSAVAQSPVHRVSASPAAERTERIGSAWQELSDDAARANDLARAQIVPDPSGRAGRTLRGVQDVEDGEFRPPRLGEAGEWGREERLSDIPTQMRDPGSFESRRPVRGFPWRYVGVVVLTGVAYFAWLYLLDRM